MAIAFISSVLSAIAGIIVGPNWNLFGEVCSKTYIPADVNGLKLDLEKNVFGQHIAQEYVSSILEHHVKYPPIGALTLYFYGPTGTGKNLVTSYIVKNLLKEGTKSRYYHYFNGVRDFAFAEKKTQYQEELKDYVQKATSFCERNIFVFDEVHKVVPGVLDALLPYIKASEPLNGLDYRKNIFIFLSNSGGEDLINLTTKYLEEGKKREDIRYEDTVPLIREERFFQNDGFKDSDLKGQISLYVPFLPLEKKHVKNCIKAELYEKRWLATNDVLNNIVGEMIYIPPGKELFSSIGCRKVKVKMELYVQDFFK